jgi:predicted acyltransferase
MIFVNDHWTLKGIPEWLEHTVAEADGMGLADTVFPAFLFIVGMSIPISVNTRRTKGDNTGKIVIHILGRTVALLVMGLFLVNGEYMNEAATGMRRGVWNSICCIAFIFLWNSWPSKIPVWLVRTLQAIAIAALLVLAWLYRGGESPGDSGRFTTYWWGILGLIGWAYFVSALIVTFTGNRIAVNIFAWLLFLFICIASHAGWLPDNTILKEIISPLGDGAMPAFTMGGVVTTLIFLHYRKKNQHLKMTAVIIGAAAVLFVFGLYTRTFWGISKIRATPAWVLICSAITMLAFLIVYWIADRKGRTKWAKLIEPAGTNTLLCYLLPYFAYAAIFIIPFRLPDMAITGVVGLIKSLVFALLIVVAAGWLGKRGVRLRL